MNTVDNSDPRWGAEIHAAIELKVDEAMANIRPRLELRTEDGPLDEADRRNMLRAAFREIVKATSVDTLMTAPADMLEQFSVIAYERNENIKGLLVQVIRCFMLAYSYPETTHQASGVLSGMEALAHFALATNGMPQNMKWKPMPGSVRPGGAVSDLH